MGSAAALLRREFSYTLKEFSVTRRRIQQIEKGAILKLGHYCRYNRIRPYIDSDWDIYEILSKYAQLPVEYRIHEKLAEDDGVESDWPEDSFDDLEDPEL